MLEDSGTSLALSNILYRNVTISDKQEFIIENIQSLIDNYKNIRLLVIDSVIGNYRAEYQGTHMLSKRQKNYIILCANCQVSHKAMELQQW